MTTIPIFTGGKPNGFTLIDDADLALIDGLRLYGGPRNYISTWSVRTGRVLLHRVILPPPAGKYIDHINGDGRDNRRANLRICTSTQNNANRRVRVDSATGLKGAYPVRRKFIAQITWRGRVIHIGTFDTAAAAHAAYILRALVLYGPFAYTK